MELQHVNAKLLVKDSEGFDLEALVPIFHSWIENQNGSELLLDIADYQHVPAGPGVVLIGNDGDYSVDNADGRLGVRYNRKAALEGGNQDRLEQAARAALKACRRLEVDPRLGGKFHFNGHEIEIFINDRLLAPNSDATREAAQRDFKLFAARLFGGAEYTLLYPNDPRRLFGVTLKTALPFSAADLLAGLA